MKFLIIGGTRFVGLAITQEAVRRGHQVSVFHRGITASEELTGVQHIIGDRDADLSVLTDAEQSWDVTIDVCAYRPHQVDALADALGGRAGRYVYISTISVYADDTPVHSNEHTGKLVDFSPLDGEDHRTVPIGEKTYGPLKLLCENRAKDRFGDILIIRPTYVVGPGDYTMRFPNWLKRISEGGVVDCPKPAENPMQYVDARDQATFTVALVEKSISGVFNCCLSPETTFGQMLEGIVRAVGAPGVSLNWIELTDEEAKLATANYPLWSGRDGSPMMTMDASAAVEKGLTFRPLEETVRDTMSWLS
ncbi:unnamed protein product, partial [Ectocarpus fasciculatus]